MDNPGLRNLGDAAITGAVTNLVITAAPDEQGINQAYIGSLDGMLAATLQANFNAGNGAGTSCIVDVFTSLDQGTTWWQVVRLKFLNVNGEKVVNLSGLSPRTTPATPTLLADDTCLDGVFGDRWRASITTVGTFGGNASVSCRMQAR